VARDLTLFGVTDHHHGGNIMNYFGVAGASAARRSALAATGVPLAVTHWAMLGMALIVFGGVLMIGARLAPRVAVDPVQDASGSYRLRLTLNGKPLGRRG
jgi:hypothetical protein